MEETEAREEGEKDKGPMGMLEVEITTKNGYTFTIDAEDVGRIKEYGWCGCNRNSPRILIFEKMVNGKRKAFYLHRLIVNAKSSEQVVPLDGNYLNCTRSNLNKVTLFPTREYTRLASIWQNMKKRCGNPSAKDYPRYGKRNITVSDEFKMFALFAKWAFDNGYSDSKQIHRVDNDLGYRPDNCVWVTPEDHGKLHRSNNH